MDMPDDIKLSGGIPFVPGGTGTTGVGGIVPFNFVIVVPVDPNPKEEEAEPADDAAAPAGLVVIGAGGLEGSAYEGEGAVPPPFGGAAAAASAAAAATRAAGCLTLCLVLVAASAAAWAADSSPSR